MSSNVFASRVRWSTPPGAQRQTTAVFYALFALFSVLDVLSDEFGRVARIRQAPHGPDHLLQLRSDRQAQELAASDQRYLVSRNNSGANGRQRSQ